MPLKRSLTTAFAVSTALTLAGPSPFAGRAVSGVPRLLPLAALAQEEPAEAPPVRSANERSIKLEGQLHVQLNTSSVDSVVTSDSTPADAPHGARRRRSGFTGALQTDFGTDRVRSATRTSSTRRAKCSPCAPASSRSRSTGSR